MGVRFNINVPIKPANRLNVRGILVCGFTSIRALF